MLSEEQRRSLDEQAYYDVNEYLSSYIWYNAEEGRHCYCDGEDDDAPVDWDDVLGDFLAQVQEDREAREDALANGQKPEATWWDISGDPEVNEFYRAAYVHYYIELCEAARENEEAKGDTA